MPRRTDIHSILIIGSGPIVIGQGCEFDYSGVQACRALREEGYRVVLVNSNPATIMTDPEFADATYIEPITPEAVEKILKREKEHGTPVDAVLPTLGGQTGLNTAMACFDQGIFTKYGVQMIGANREAIFKGEDRQVFKDLMIKIGLKVPRSGVVHNMDDARKVLDDIGLPLIIRPAFTLGGTGGGIAYNVEEFEAIVQRGIDASPVNEVLIEQSVIGWKEFELEVMRDRLDNVVIICSIENMDPMGVHTGDSITVAPVQTLTDKEYQRMRDAAIAVIRAVGVETGGSNIQFGVNPDNGDMVVIEMNPRVSRSSALASKATGYPIAKIAAKLAVGYTLDELPNYITSKKDPKTGEWTMWTSACFEPTIDYCVIKIPRWTFEKFPDADETLTTQMKSVGEAMAIGRTFKEALQKGIRSMEVKRFGFGLDKYDKWLNAQRSEAKAAGSGTGILPVQGAPEPGKHQFSPFKSAPHGQDARATAGQKLPPTARADLAGATRDNDYGGPDASDKTTQGESLDHEWPIPEDKLRRKLSVPSQGRLYYVRYALKMGWSVETIHELTNIDPWFLGQMKELVEFEDEILRAGEFARELYPHLTGEVQEQVRISKSEMHFLDTLIRAKQLGYSDVQLATAWQLPPSFVREARPPRGLVYKLVDTCAAEFEAATPYYYSTYETHYTQNGKPVVEDEIRLTDKPKIIIIGGGPNRIGQGIEFDYCCVHAAFAMKELGFESVMINSNPETVSTDYDTSDLLFFEPLTHEDILNICERLNGGPFTREPSGSAAGQGLVKGVIVQFGGQTPLNLAKGLKEAGVPIIGTSVESIDAAGDREQFRALLQRLGLRQPENGIARNVNEAREIARRIGYPVLVRPSFVLGGRAMEIVSDEDQLNYYMTHAVEASTIADAPILVDKFLDAATECDVDCIADYEPVGAVGERLLSSLAQTASAAKEVRASIEGRDHDPTSAQRLRAGVVEMVRNVDKLSPGFSQKLSDAMPEIVEEARSSSEYEGRAVVIGVMEHIEEAGIHSGDSACALPPYSLSGEIVQKLKEQTRALAKALRVRGLMNVQYAIKDDEIYVIEVNPRASRTVPFVGKATGVPWAKIAAKVMAGKSLAELGVSELPDPTHTSVKESVFPFSKFQGVDVILGPEMRSTGEVMGIDRSFPLAFAKSQIAAGTVLPTKGTVYISVRDADKEAVVPVAQSLARLGFEIISTAGTHAVLARCDVPATRIQKLAEGRPNIRDYIKNGKVQLIINTPTRKGPRTDEGKIRSLAVLNKVPIVTTITGASAAARAIEAMQAEEWSVKPLQEYFGLKAGAAAAKGRPAAGRR